MVWVADEERELTLPEPEEVKKEVWGTLGAVVSHANIAKNMCHILYEPKEDKDVEGGNRMPVWELKETSPLKNKWKKYVPTETRPNPAAARGKNPFYFIMDTGKYSGDRVELGAKCSLG